MNTPGGPAAQRLELSTQSIPTRMRAPSPRRMEEEETYYNEMTSSSEEERIFSPLRSPSMRRESVIRSPVIPMSSSRSPPSYDETASYSSPSESSLRDYVEEEDLYPSRVSPPRRLAGSPPSVDMTESYFSSDEEESPNLQPMRSSSRGGPATDLPDNFWSFSAPSAGSPPRSLVAHYSLPYRSPSVQRRMRRAVIIPSYKSQSEREIINLISRPMSPR